MVTLATSKRRESREPRAETADHDVVVFRFLVKDLGRKCRTSTYKTNEVSYRCDTISLSPTPVAVGGWRVPPGMNTLSNLRDRREIGHIAHRTSMTTQ
jgi:hypothetical protein